MLSISSLSPLLLHNPSASAVTPLSDRLVPQRLWNKGKVDMTVLR